MDTTVMLGHGSGGTMMKRIIDEVFFAAYAGEELLRGDDAAVLPAPAQGERLAFSTDSFVVTPHFFPGGDIGRLAVCGTVNDVATSGATPRYLSCGFVLEEGFPIEDLKRRIQIITENSMKNAEYADRIAEIERIITERASHQNEYDDSIVRQMVECIKVYADKHIEVIFGGGYAVEETME